MPISTIKKVTCTLALAMLTILPAMAQKTYRLPGQHNAEHQDLIAGQMNMKDQIKVDNTQKYLDELFAEEEEPEFDIYTEGWDSQYVNCYQGANVPQTQVIDVTNYAMPHPGYLTSPYGYRQRFKRMHKGVDIKVNIGDTIRAAFDGRIRLTKYEAKGYGYYVVVRHGNDLETVYGHLSRFLVKPNQYVKAGDPIALGGSTGRSTGPHLHFETRFMGYAINPCAIFDFASQTTHTDYYTFDKRTYQQARDFSPAANQAYQREYMQTYGNRSTASSSRGKSSSKGNKSYTVKKGDTLSKIASRNGTTVQKICKLNGIKSSATLNPGKKIKVR
jgi:murein DD-endopeptidase MepM/ murein hydrolase activator NlpD